MAYNLVRTGFCRFQQYQRSLGTSRVTIHTMSHEDRTIHLIDTPGFNDTERSDSETLQELAFWLSAAYRRSLHLNGIIYLHPINNPRLPGSASMSLNAFKSLVGEKSYHGVVLATSMWDKVAPNQMEHAAQRHQELCKNPWADILSKGGRTVSLSAGRIDAMKIVAHIASTSHRQRLTLALQHQLENEEKSLHETDAGRVLIQSLEQQYKDTLGVLEDTLAAQIRTVQSNTITKYGKPSEWENDTGLSMKPLEDGMALMKKSMNDVRSKWEIRLQKDRETLEEASKKNEEQLNKLKEELARLYRRTHSPSPSDSPSLDSNLPLQNGYSRWSISPSSSSAFLSSTEVELPGWRLPRSPSPSSTYMTPTNGMRSLTPNYTISETRLIRDIEELNCHEERFDQWKQTRLENRYTPRKQGHNAAWSVVGTVIGMGQLAAALACNVM